MSENNLHTVVTRFFLFLTQTILWFVVLVILFGRSQVSVPVQAQESIDGQLALMDSLDTTQVAIPWLEYEHTNSSTTNQDADSLLCRFGVNAPSGVTKYPVADLRVSWYQNYATSPNPSRPQDMEYVQMVRLKQSSGDTYIPTPSTSVISQTAALNPGSIWFIGNEPDRLFYQDGIEPLVYAKAYHDLYHLIKSVDPTARVFAGSIVQPTVIRLIYLDLILSAYQQTFGTRMPVDGWSIHNFILNELSCAVSEEDCWGADIPPGVDVIQGLRIDVQQHDDFDLFVEQIERFRYWMWLNGYQDTPLYLSEYGVLMPKGVFKPDFSEQRVNQFMDRTFDYLLTVTDERYGYRADGNRLVQRLSWFSTDFTQYNGQLFDSKSGAYTSMGTFYKDYAQLVQEAVDFYPVAVTVDPPILVDTGEPVTVTVTAQVANSGNNFVPQDVEVRFYDGDPQSGGAQIGETQLLQLAGCGAWGRVSVTWPNLGSGVHDVYVTVNGLPGGVVEDNPALTNNQVSERILVTSEQIYLPTLRR